MEPQPRPCRRRRRGPTTVDDATAAPTPTDDAPHHLPEHLRVAGSSEDPSPPSTLRRLPACVWWGAILQIEEASNFRWRRPQPAAGRAPWTCVAGILRHARHLLSVGVKSIFFRVVESTLTLIRSAAAPRVLPKQP